MRLVAECLVAFSAFLRYDELAKLKCCVTFSPQSMSIRIASSKTDQYRQGDNVLAARTDSPISPVAMLERYFSMAALPKQSKLHFFRKYKEQRASSFTGFPQLHSVEGAISK